MEKDASIGQTLAQAKETIWIDILDSMNEIFPCIQIIFEQKELIQKATETIVQVREKIGDMPTDASNIIKSMNSKNKYEFEELGISDRNATILEVKKVLTKRNLIDQLEERCETLEMGVKRFSNRIEALIQWGFPNIYVINDKLITQEDYVLKMEEGTRSNIKFSGIKGSMTTREFLETMTNEFFIENEVKHVFTIKPTFEKYTKVDEIYWRVIKLTILDEKRLEELCHLLD